MVKLLEDELLNVIYAHAEGFEDYFKTEQGTITYLEDQLLQGNIYSRPKQNDEVETTKHKENVSLVQQFYLTALFRYLNIVHPEIKSRLPQIYETYNKPRGGNQVDEFIYTFFIIKK